MLNWKLLCALLHCLLAPSLSLSQSGFVDPIHWRDIPDSLTIVRGTTLEIAGEADQGLPDSIVSIRISNLPHLQNTFIGKWNLQWNTVRESRSLLSASLWQGSSSSTPIPYSL